MIDTHCHLLHALDDGPAMLSESVALARSLHAAGVEQVVCTPHLSRRYALDLELAGQRLAELEEALSAAGIDLRLSLAAELSPAVAIELTPSRLRAVAIGGRFVLVEVEVSTTTAMITAVAAHFAEVGLTPILAHPERSRAVRRDPQALSDAVGRGAVVQVVARSLRGAWGAEIERAAWSLTTSGVADIVASDAHRATDAAEALRGVLESLVRRVGAEAQRRLVVDRPRALVAGSAA